MKAKEIEKRLVTSASQIDDFEACRRRWWFKRVMRLPEVQKSYFTFGTILHGCLERWMLATENGRVPESENLACRLSDRALVIGEGPMALQVPGAAVDIFPKGWEQITEKGQAVSITPNEAALIRKLVAQAIERGIIERHEGMDVEREVFLPVIEGVDLIGYEDVFIHPRPFMELHDHKSFGERSTRYLKQPGPTDEGGNLIEIVAPYKKGDGTSPNSVGHNQQLLTYGAASSLIDGYDGPVVFQHNQFPKFLDPKGVRKVRALVSNERLMQHWAHVQEIAADMLRVRRIKEWKDTPGPESSDACSQYGGCPFLGICGRQETPQGYLQRVERLKQRSAKNARPNFNLKPRDKRTSDGGNANMGGIFSKLPGKSPEKAAATAPTPSPTSKPAAKPAAAAAVKAATQPQNPAPWANPKCPACKGVGVNSKGHVCPICDSTAKRNNKPTSAMYAISHTEEGLMVAMAKDEEAAEALVAADMPLEWAQEAAPAAAPAQPAKATAAPAAPKAKAAPAAAPAKAEPAAAPAKAPAAAKPAKAASGVFKAPPSMPPKGPKGPAPEPEPEAAPEPEVVESAPESKAKGAAAGGRPKTGLTILVSCAQVVGPRREVVLAQQLMEELGAQIAEDMGIASYWAIDTWKRRDKVRERAQAVAESLSRKVLVYGGVGDPDTQNLVAALIPFAEVVIEGLA